MEAVVRYYDKKDYASLAELLGEVYGSRITQEVLEKQYVTGDRSILIAQTREGGLTGCAFLEVKEDFVRPERIMYVTYVAVAEEYRKQGIGRKIFAEIENICRKKGCKAIELTSANFRTEAHAFYESMGFTKKQTTLFIKEW